jgi:hypothetical protein
MKKGDVLKISILFCKVLYMVIAVAATGTTFVFVHLQVEPQYYLHWNANFLSQSGTLSYKFFEKWNSGLVTEDALLSLPN